MEAKDQAAACALRPAAKAIERAERAKTDETERPGGRLRHVGKGATAPGDFAPLTLGETKFEV
jgi:hypothetical protein